MYSRTVLSKFPQFIYFATLLLIVMHAQAVFLASYATPLIAHLGLTATQPLFAALPA